MNQIRNFTLIRVLLFAVLGTVVSTGLLCAEDYAGTFTLPVETKWADATLPPGEYEFKLNVDVIPYMITVRGKEASVLTLPIERKQTRGLGHSVLLIVRHGNKGTVRDLRLGEPGLVFTYPLPKGERRMLAQEPVLYQRIPVLMAAK